MASNPVGKKVDAMAAGGEGAKPRNVQDIVRDVQMRSRIDAHVSIETIEYPVVTSYESGMYRRERTCKADLVPLGAFVRDVPGAATQPEGEQVKFVENFFHALGWTVRENSEGTLCLEVVSSRGELLARPDAQRRSYEEYMAEQEIPVDPQPKFTAGTGKPTETSAKQRFGDEPPKAKPSKPEGK